MPQNPVFEVAILYNLNVLNTRTIHRRKDIAVDANYFRRQICMACFHDICNTEKSYIHNAIIWKEYLCHNFNHIYTKLLNSRATQNHRTKWICLFRNAINSVSSFQIRCIGDYIYFMGTYCQ